MTDIQWFYIMFGHLPFSLASSGLFNTFDDGKSKTFQSGPIWHFGQVLVTVTTPNRKVHSNLTLLMDYSYWHCHVGSYIACLFDKQAQLPAAFILWSLKLFPPWHKNLEARIKHPHVRFVSPWATHLPSTLLSTCSFASKLWPLQKDLNIKWKPVKWA